MFTSTRSFVAQFLPPQCTPGTQMPSWCTACQPLLLLNHPKSKGAAIKWPPRGAGVPPIKKPHSKAYLSVMVLYGCGRVAADPKLFICRPASELCGGQIGLKSAFYPGSDRFIVDEQHLVPTWISARRLVSLLPFQIQCWGNCCQLQSIANAL